MTESFRMCHYSETEGLCWSNPGLFFDRGFPEWKQESDDRGEDIQKFIRQVCEIDVPDVYKHAFERWQTVTGDQNNFATAVGVLNKRLYIGMGMPHVLETQVTRQQTYGMPMLPGSALKGLARSYAEKVAGYDKSSDIKLPQDVIDVLFGKAGDTPEDADSGYLIFYDAWWVNNMDGVKKPYVPEVVTVHAAEYYTNCGKACPHPDLESPNPNNQIAVQGGFYFVVGGKKKWAELGMKFLKHALEDDGIGGKVSSGYGFFKFPDNKECRKIINLGRKLFMEKKDRQDRANLLAGFDPFQLAIYNLSEAVKSRENGKIYPTNNDLNALVNKIIKKNDSEWPGEMRQKAFPLIKKAWRISLKSNQQKKKIPKLDNWLETGVL